ncbi:acyl-CoA thioesterase II [Lacisediminimonas sp.]|uniref:acyl-CoA thioesterase n=1 Tax=Lacisediminimonas sp. TaxID=3060582 RepID=UPI0027258221|nr:acyl-CoA thioesterase II [Lacisediminimonas sp.]MDO8300981.1 acyl-CoA thioesterase II [Lacisediminimonas sp.]
MADSGLFNTNIVLDILRLEPDGHDRYIGQSHFMGSPNVFGGQVLGQSLYAALATVEGRRPHSMHALFLLRGDYRLPITYEVERVRDGSSFSTRRVVAFQENRRIFVMSASFQILEDGFSHQKSIPCSIDPNSLPSRLPEWKASADLTDRPFQPVPVDFRAPYEGDLFGSHDGTPHKQVWMRAPFDIGDDIKLHESLFAYVSDYGLLWTALQPHGVRVGDPRLQVASLDHAIWFHRPFRMDQWLRFEMESPNASGARGLSFAHVYDEQGVLVATLAQEGLIRMHEASPQASQ